MRNDLWRTRVSSAAERRAAIIKYFGIKPGDQSVVVSREPLHKSGHGLRVQTKPCIALARLEMTTVDGPLSQFQDEKPRSNGRVYASPGVSSPVRESGRDGGLRLAQFCVRIEAAARQHDCW